MKSHILIIPFMLNSVLAFTLPTSSPLEVSPAHRWSPRCQDYSPLSSIRMAIG